MKVRLKQQALAAGLIAFAPLAMAFVRRSSTLLLAATALASLILGRRTIAQNWRAARFDPALLAGLALLALWACVTLLWSPLPARGLKQLVFDFMLPVAAGFILLAQPRHSLGDHALAWQLLPLAVAGGFVAAQLFFQLRIEAFLNPKENPNELWRFNMVVVTLALFLPALMMAMRRAPLAAACAALMIILAVTLSQSASAKMAVIAGLFAYALFRAVPRRVSLVLTGTALFALLAIQPWQGRLIEQGFAATGKTDILFASAKERIVIWKATGAMALHALPLGTGMGSSDAVSETAFAKSMPPELAVGLRQTHAHNAFLNIIMELGVPGWIGLVLITFGVLRTMRGLPDALYAPAMALSAQIFTVDLISHGAWQAWWFTAIMLGIFALTQHAQKDEYPSR
jgi:hypothetical protein